MASNYIFLNGKACNDQPLRQAIYQLRAEGFPLEVRVSWEAGNIERYLDEALNQGCQRLIAAGGDGTLNAVANALMQLQLWQRPSLGVVALGTANDFASSAGIPLEPEPALRLALSGKPTPIDLILVNDKRYFINMATGGFGAKITNETPAKLKAALGGVSYLLHGLARMDSLQAESCQISGENFSWQGEALVIAVGNGCQAGGGQRLCPSAQINDGKMELAIVAAQQWLPTLLHSVTSRDENPNIITHRCEQLLISSQQEMLFNLDGEPISGTEFSLRIKPNALSCHLPPNCPLLR